MPNTKPVCSSAEIAHAVEAEAARVGLCDANQTVSITKDFDGKTLDHLMTLPEDVKFITEDGNGVMNNAVMARAFAIATERGLTIMSHAEDREISPWDYRLAENIETVRNCHLAEYYGTRLHMCHVSTKESVDAIRMSRLRGARVSCEVTPHHLWFDDSRLQYKVNPPIRKTEDQRVLWAALRKGEIQTVSTDHCSFTLEQKDAGRGDFTRIPGGLPGVETRGELLYTYGVTTRKISLATMCRVLSENPAKLYGMFPRKGVLQAGADADIVVYDPQADHLLRAEDMTSLAGYTPYEGFPIRGGIRQVWLRGRLAVEDGFVLAGPDGKYISRGKCSL